MAATLPKTSMNLRLKTEPVNGSHTVPKTNLNLRLKTEPVNASADATVYVWFLPMGQMDGNKNRIYSVA